MRIQILSDIHFECSSKPERLLGKILPPYNEKNTVLILAGDVGFLGSSVYMKYIEKCSELYQAVFVIAGNHEYYRSSIESVDVLVKTIEWPKNVYYLNKTCVIYEKVRFLGCTLWAVGDSRYAYEVNDFSQISDMTMTKYNELHNSDLNWLESELSKPESEEYVRTIVITHHLPSQLLVHPIYKNHHLNSFYSNNLDHLVRLADMWFCGHTHMPVRRHIGQCWCVVNPVGYSGEHSKCNVKERITVYNEEKVLYTGMTPKDGHFIPSTDLIVWKIVKRDGKKYIAVCTIPSGTPTYKEKQADIISYASTRLRIDHVGYWDYTSTPAKYVPIEDATVRYIPAIAIGSVSEYYVGKTYEDIVGLWSYANPWQTYWYDTVCGKVLDLTNIGLGMIEYKYE